MIHCIYLYLNKYSYPFGSDSVKLVDMVQNVHESSGNVLTYLQQGPTALHFQGNFSFKSRFTI